MSTSVILPALGESVTQGTITRWLKRVGDSVDFDEPLLEVSTDKVDTEIPSPVAGVLLTISAAEDDLVEVGTEIAVIGMPAEQPALAPATPAETRVAVAAQGASEAPNTPEISVAPAISAARKPEISDFLSPLVRSLVAEHRVDLSTISGTGRGGRIRKRDLAASIATNATSIPDPAATPAALQSRTEKLSRLRQIIATRMVESLQTSAQLTQVMEVDVTAIARLRERRKADFFARYGVKLTYLPFFAKAAIDALAQHPKLNATIDTEKNEATYFGYRNVAFAVDTERGLLTPVVKNADDMTIAKLASALADLAERTRKNKITPDDLAGGTFTITNLGSFGALSDTPIVNQPQVAILGLGAVVKRPVVIDDPLVGETIAIRHMVLLSLSYDHRLVDGADAGRFLAEVKRRLQAAQFDV